MIYVKKINNTSYISSFHSQNNFGKDELLYIGTYINHSTNQESQFRGLINMPILQSISSLTQKIPNIRVDEIQYELNLYSAGNILQTNNMTLTVYPLSKSWFTGYGKTTKITDTTINKSGCSWVNSDVSIPWDTPGGDYFDLYAPSCYFTNVNNSSDLNCKFDITTMCNAFLTDPSFNNGVLIMNTSSNCGLLMYYSANTNTIYGPNLHLKYNQSIYTTGSMVLVDTSKPFDLYINNIKSIYKFGQFAKFTVSVVYQYQNKNWEQQYHVQTPMAIPQRTCYQVVDFYSNQPIIPYDIHYTLLSCDGTENFFKIPTQCLDKNRLYKIVLYTIDSYYHRSFDSKFTFKVI